MIRIEQTRLGTSFTLFILVDLIHWETPEVLQYQGMRKEDCVSYYKFSTLNLSNLAIMINRTCM